jgi:cytochrome c-type biogenesis protein
MGVILIPSYGKRSPLRSAVILLVLTAVYFFIAQVAELEGDRPRLLQLGVVMLLAWLRFSGYLELRVLSRTFQVDLGRSHGVGYTRSALVGGAFALGWTPCIGPILASILTLAATSDDAFRGTYLLVAYSAGLAIPFLAAGLAVSDATKVLRRMQRYAPAIEVASGLLIIIVGTFLVTGRLTGLNQYFSFADFNGGL